MRAHILNFSFVEVQVLKRRISGDVGDQVKK
jgi:hypothetical protein